MLINKYNYLKIYIKYIINYGISAMPFPFFFKICYVMSISMFVLHRLLERDFKLSCYKYNPQ